MIPTPPTRPRIRHVYAALARREGVPLVTRDEQQRNRAAPVVEALTPPEALTVLKG
jgi:hypothetical protein